MRRRELLIVFLFCAVVPVFSQEPVLGRPTLLQEALNLLPAIPIAGRNLKFQFGGDTWIATLNGENLLAGTFKSEDTDEGSIITLNQTHIWGATAARTAGRALGRLGAAGRVAGDVAAAVTGRWMALDGPQFVLEYKDGPVPSFSLVSSSEEPAQVVSASEFTNQDSLAVEPQESRRRNSRSEQSDQSGIYQSDSSNPGKVFINGGFALGNMDMWFFSRSLLGFTASVDFALPMFGLLVGVETGYLGGSYSVWDYKTSYGVIPIMVRGGYHTSFGIDNLDVYGLIKTGLAIGRLWDNDPDDDFSETRVGFGIGFGVGGRYFFTNNIGAFVEVGFDNYSFNFDDDGWSWRVRGRKFLTTGLTIRL